MLPRQADHLTKVPVELRRADGRDVEIFGAGRKGSRAPTKERFPIGDGIGESSEIGPPTGRAGLK